MCPQAKVQYLIQADSMLTCHASTIRHHDQRVLNTSGLLEQMSYVVMTDPATGLNVLAKL